MFGGAKAVAVGSECVWSLRWRSLPSIPCQPHHQAFLTHHNNKKKKISLFSSLPTSATAALPFDLSPPPIDHDLLDTVTVAGAQVSEDGIIETFDNDNEALDAVDNGVVKVDVFFSKV